MDTLGKVKLLIGILLLVALIDIALLVTSFFAVGQCYITPCQQFQFGLDVVWKVSQGKGFQLVSSALFFGFQALLAVRALNKTPSPSPLVMGLLIGSVFGSAILALETSAVWGSEVTGITDLGNHLVQTGKPNAIDTRARPTFEAASTLSAIMFASYTLLSILMICWRAELTSSNSESPSAYYESAHVSSAVADSLTSDGQSLAAAADSAADGTAGGYQSNDGAAREE